MSCAFRPTGRGWVDLSALLALLASESVGSVMEEGGARVITSFFSERLVDHVVLTVAPVVLGGMRAVKPMEGVYPEFPKASQHGLQEGGATTWLSGGTLSGTVPSRDDLMSHAALVFAAPYRVEVQSSVLGSPGPGEALVKTLVSAISLRHGDALVPGPNAWRDAGR